MLRAPANTACPNHLLHLYGRDQELARALADYVHEGVAAGESILLIATASHTDEVEELLAASGLPLDHLRFNGRYRALLAESVLGQIAPGGMPEEARFEAVVGPYVYQMSAYGRKVRAFGEMVGLLMQQGKPDAAVELERIWDGYCRENHLRLLCSYQERLFAGAGLDATNQIRLLHGRQLPNA